MPAALQMAEPKLQGITVRLRLMGSADYLGMSKSSYDEGVYVWEWLSARLADMRVIRGPRPRRLM